MPHSPGWPWSGDNCALCKQFIFYKVGVQLATSSPGCESSDLYSMILHRGKEYKEGILLGLLMSTHLPGCPGANPWPLTTDWPIFALFNAMVC